MTNYEKIKFLLEMGVYKGVTLDRYIGPHRYIETFASVSELGDGLITDTGKIYSEKEIKKRGAIINITPIPNPPKLLPVGTKVRVFEEYIKQLGGRERDELTRITHCSIDEVLVNGYGYILEVAPAAFIKVPARAVVPVLD